MAHFDVPEVFDKSKGIPLTLLLVLVENPVLAPHEETPRSLVVQECPDVLTQNGYASHFVRDDVLGNEFFGNGGVAANDGLFIG